MVQLWKPFEQKVYPNMLKVINHDWLLKAFVQAALLGLLPKMESSLTEDKLAAKFPKRNRYFGVLGIAPGLDRAGGVQSQRLLEDWGPISFLELGPSTIEAQNPPDQKTKMIRIEPPNVVYHFAHSRYGLN